jgi:oligopeptide/dipeptide ABC transporter ATP-binding protein
MEAPTLIGQDRFDDTLLEVNDLKTSFFIEGNQIRAVDGISFIVRRASTLGVVGESGCGKSVTALSIMRLVKQPPATLQGDVLLHRPDGTIVNLLGFKRNSDQMRQVRGKDVSMIFQEPMTSLNPVYSIGSPILETIQSHEKVTKIEARQRASDLLAAVGIANPKQRLDEYPHQFSGGMRQRVMIAAAIACHPSLLIADEPTTALDVTIQAQILDLLLRLQQEHQMSTMLITHDLGVVASTCQDLIVMYLGKVVESGQTKAVFDQPTHPYTRGLLKSIPALSRGRGHLRPIEGMVPSADMIPPGCRFEPRCPVRLHNGDCQRVEPQLIEVEAGHFVSCLLFDKTFGR